MNRDYIFEIMGENPINLKLMNETLWDIKEKNFSNLYTAQKSITGITRFDLSLKDFNKKSFSLYNYSVNFTFITDTNRLQYRKSKFYGKSISFDTVAENPTLFSYIPLLFIDGVLYSNFFIKPYEDVTTIEFKIYSGKTSHDGFTQEDFLQMLSYNPKVSIVFVYNCHQCIRTNLNIHTLKNYTNTTPNSGLPIIGQFTDLNKIDKSESCFTFSAFDDKRRYKYRLMDTEYRDNRVFFNPDHVAEFENTHIDTRLLFLLHNTHRITMKGDDVYFKLDIHDMPVPTENMIIFKWVGNTLVFDHETKIKIYYPSIYELLRTDASDYEIFVFYSDDTSAIGSKYDNELQLYHRFITNFFDKYKDDTIPDLVKNYKAIEFNYDFKDYFSNEQYPDHIIYRMNKLRETIQRYGKHYSIYLSKLVGYVPRYYIHYNDIDWKERRRVNNFNEVKDKDNQVEFDSSRYLLTFRHDGNYDKMIMYINNYMYEPDMQFIDERYRYIYVPTPMIKPSTIIEVERLLDTYYNEKISYSADYIHVELPKNGNFSLYDLFLCKMENGIPYYIDRDLYSMYVKVNDEYKLVEYDDFFKYPDFYLKLDSSLEHYDIYLYGNKVNFTMTNTGNEEFVINQIINNDTRNILLFKNGRLLPPKAMKIIFNEDARGPHKVRCLSSSEPTDRFVMMYTLNKHIFVYHQNTILKNGYVNLTGRLNKPIDLRWYDIYLNGIKLHENNIDILTSDRMLIKDVNTRLNLTIYQRNLDTVVKGIAIDDEEDKLLDEIPDILKDVIENLPDLPDELPDITDDVVVDIIDFFDRYGNTLGLINPDIKQITNEMLETNIEIFDEFNNLFINPESTTLKLADAVYLNPDSGITSTTKVL